MSLKGVPTALGLVIAPSTVRHESFFLAMRCTSYMLIYDVLSTRLKELFPSAGREAHRIHEVVASIAPQMRDIAQGDIEGQSCGIQ